MKKLSKYELFKKECLRLQKVYALLDWDFYFEKFSEKEGSYAQVNQSIFSRWAKIGYNEYELNKCNISQIKETARHEVVHILVAELTDNLKPMEENLETQIVERNVVKLTRLLKDL